MNLMEHLTEDLQNTRDELLQLVAEACLVAENVNMPLYFPDTEKS
jgi:hypothetical protein